MVRMPRRFLTLLAALTALAATAAPARAELVLLQGGDVLKVKAYEVRDQSARLTLPSGGVLTVALMRIDRVLADEIIPRPEVDPELQPAESPVVELAFAEGLEASAPFAAEILDAARRHDVNPAVIAAVMRVESGFDPRARSHKGARGLMQLMPATAARFGVGVDELYTPARNLEAGVRYLAFLRARFADDATRVFAAYNAGEGAVERHGGVPPYRETRDYVKKVFRHLGVEAPAPGPAAAGTAVAAAGTR
jgi:soluble lytic murein transglycosylase-like protein